MSADAATTAAATERGENGAGLGTAAATAALAAAGPARDATSGESVKRAACTAAEGPRDAAGATASTRDIAADGAMPDTAATATGTAARACRAAGTAKTAATASPTAVATGRTAGATNGRVVREADIAEGDPRAAGDKQPAAEPRAAAASGERPRAAGSAMRHGIVDRQVFECDLTGKDEEAALGAPAVDCLNRGSAAAVRTFDRQRRSWGEIDRQQIGGQIDLTGDVDDVVRARLRIASAKIDRGDDAIEAANTAPAAGRV
jgi:hypothetical protein